MIEPNPGYGAGVGSGELPYTLPVKAVGICTGAGSAENSRGISSITLISTGRLRFSLEEPFTGGAIYPCWTDVHQGPNSNSFWSHPGLPNDAYFESINTFGNPTVFATVNPAYISFLALDVIS